MTQMLRVAHLTPSYFSANSVIGGGERYVHNIVQALQTVGGFEQCVFAVGTSDRLLEIGDTPIRVLRNRSPWPGAMDGLSPELWRELPGYDIAHIHQSLTNFGIYATAIVSSLGIPSIGTDLGGSSESPAMLRGRGIELLDGVLSISEYAYSLIADCYSGPHRILIGPIDTDHFHPFPIANRDQRTILCVSRILPHKGIDRVISALPSGLRLVVVGRIYNQEYYSLLCRMAEGKDVQFVDDADDHRLLELYCSCGLFVQASTIRDIYGTVVAKPELMGLTALEAMACGLPIVLSDAGSLPELVTDSRFGRVFSSHEELCAILEEFSLGRWPEPDAGHLARAHVVATHSMAAIGTRLAEFYQSVVSAKQFV